MCQSVKLDDHISPSQQTCDKDVIISILPLGRLRLTEGKLLAHDHTTGMDMKSHLSMPPGPLQFSPQASREME